MKFGGALCLALVCGGCTSTPNVHAQVVDLHYRLKAYKDATLPNPRCGLTPRQVEELAKKIDEACADLEEATK